MRELDYGKIGIRIRQARKAKGWSQDGLAKRCGISVSFLGHIERGTRIMSLDTFAAICSVLDMNADGLLWGKCIHRKTCLICGNCQARSQPYLQKVMPGMCGL